ncbi:MAG: sensor domain-containing diguanylate cyclase [Azoarcus sp.]|nr:sensor domain-containing diguanylate cyclase [Azoarcus sp.]
MSDDLSDEGQTRSAGKVPARHTGRSLDEASPLDRALLQELQLHQLELEMQNEALRKAQSALEVARDRYVDLFDFAPVAYLTLSRDGRITEANFVAARALSVPRSELMKQRIERFVAPRDADRWHRQADAAWQAAGASMPDFELLLKDGNGLEFPAQMHCMTTARSNSDPLMRIALFDNTERNAAAAEMQRMANYDSLTELPNRHLFQDRLAHAVSAGRRNGMYGAVLFLDLDNFKMLNDTCGHDAGDRLLTEVAHRLRSSLREGDTVARLGGDEFVMILEGLGTSERPAARLATQVANKLNRKIAHPVAIGTGVFQCTTSVGVRMFGPEEGAQDLVKQADFALYQAKSAGRNQVRLFVL